MKNININFYCIGAQKAGTTTLHDILKNHPNICLPNQKEAPFYQNDSQYSKGKDWYEKKYFSHYNNEKIVGSISPEFMYYPWIPERIKETYGSNIKFVVLLRNPIDRAVSHYNMSKGRNIEKRDFLTAIKSENKTITRSFYHNKQFSYINRGLYSVQIERYFKLFPKENFLFIKFEDFISDQQTIIKQICRFLEIDLLESTKFIKSNESIKYKIKFIPWLESRFPLTISLIKKSIPKSIRAKIASTYKTNNSAKYAPENSAQNYLISLFKDDIKKLEKLTNLQLSNWTENDEQIASNTHV